MVVRYIILETITRKGWQSSTYFTLFYKLSREREGGLPNFLHYFRSYHEGGKAVYYIFHIILETITRRDGSLLHILHYSRNYHEGGVVVYNIFYIILETITREGWQSSIHFTLFQKLSRGRCGSLLHILHYFINYLEKGKVVYLIFYIILETIKREVWWSTTSFT